MIVKGVTAEFLIVVEGVRKKSSFLSLPLLLIHERLHLIENFHELLLSGKQQCALTLADAYP